MLRLNVRGSKVTEVDWLRGRTRRASGQYGRGNVIGV